MDNTIIQQGSFTSTGEAVTLDIRSDVDWMTVYNTTVAADDTQTTAIGVEYYWQRGFATATGIEYRKSNAANASQLTTFLASGGFTLVDTSEQAPGALISTITDISAGDPPVVTNTGVNGLNVNDIVRLINISGAQQLGGMEFTVGFNTLTDTTFSLDHMPAIAAVVAGTGSWRVIPNPPQFAPEKNFISEIDTGISTTIRLTKDFFPNYVVGMSFRIKVPSVYGMSEIDGLIGNITSLNFAQNSIIVDIDSSSFSAFSFPLTTDVPFDPAEVNPVGEDATGTVANSLDDATDNISLIGMILAAGVDSPAGQTDDVIFWRAGKSFSVTNV